MFWRALAAFLALPGIVAFIVPVLFVEYGPRGWNPLMPGLLPLFAGALLLLWCVREFHVAGKGTLAPWAPPQHLVTSGPYRYSRNPMYVAVSLILLGWAAAFPARGLLIYALAVIAAFHLRIILGEEPWLARTHGAAWEQYRKRVPRWLW